RDQVQFQQADALDMPFLDSSFDAVMMEHVSMNVADKARLFKEIKRVLKPRGILADYVICSGSKSPPHYPVPWSDDGSASFLETVADYQTHITLEGFRIREARDV